MDRSVQTLTLTANCHWSYKISSENMYRTENITMQLYYQNHDEPFLIRDTSEGLFTPSSFPWQVFI